jgi:hypothetical protein
MRRLLVILAALALVLSVAPAASADLAPPGFWCAAHRPHGDNDIVDTAYYHDMFGGSPTTGPWVHVRCRTHGPFGTGSGEIHYYCVHIYADNDSSWHPGGSPWCPSHGAGSGPA